MKRQKTLSTPRLARVATLAAILVCSASSMVLAEPCEEDDPKVVRIAVTLDWDEKVIVVDPESVEIYLEPGPDRANRVCWIIDGLQDGQTLFVAGKPDQEDLFPSLERRVKFPREFANSGNPSAAGTWIYELYVTDADDHEVLRKDPEVIINP